MRFNAAAVGFSCLILLAAGAFGAEYTQGTLRRMDRQGQPVADCPLKHTAVNAEISGMLARVNVVQEFQNPFAEAIEAVYVFPLPQDAAVDQMTMLVGGRVIQGKIKRREEARAIYEAARNAGQTASLLNQERPNIFTQSVANIPPGDNIKITISYVDTLKYSEGSYEFVFPMVVGPRYIPGRPIGKQAGGWSPDTSRVPDASRITPQVTPEGVRAGHDISIEVAVDAGLPIVELDSKTHHVDVQRPAASRALVRLRDENVIPNKDFILRYASAGRTIQDAVLTHRSTKEGFFTLILQPPDHVPAADVSPKELIFVLDTSGSMSGFPIEKAKEAMRLALDGLYPQDTFNLITFSGDTNILFPEPVPATYANLRIAQMFLQSRAGSGGTEMMKAIRAALAPSVESGRVRIVCFMTDGYVGNDMEIIAEVQKHPDARVFAFGIGQSVNRYLLDSMAEYGRGEVEYVGLMDDGPAAARRFHQRVREPLLTSLSIDWGGLPVTDVYPKQLPDLFSAKPVVVMGRYAGPGQGVVRLRGQSGGREVVREIAMALPMVEEKHDVLATLWARKRIADLMSQDLMGAQRGVMQPEVQEQITQLGLGYRLMTQFTSFVAVEERIVNENGQPVRIEVPVEMPEGVSYQGVFGTSNGTANAPARMRVGGNVSGAVGSGGGIGAGVVGGVPGGMPGGSAGGVIGGTMSSVPVAAPPPPPPAAAPAPARQFDAGRLLAPSAVPKPIAMSRGSSGYLLSQKLDPALVTMLESGDQTSKVDVQILLGDTSAATMDLLKNLGFEVLQPAGRDLQVVGRIALDKLAELAQIPAVRYIVPVKGGPG